MCFFGKVILLILLLLQLLLLTIITIMVIKIMMIPTYNLSGKIALSNLIRWREFAITVHGPLHFSNLTLTHLIPV